MRVVFYSTNSNVFEDETFKINVMPENAVAFQNFCASHPEDEFFCVTQKPGMFLPETNFTGIKFRSVSTSNNNNHLGNYNNINYNNGELLAHRYGNTSNSNKARNNTKDRKLNPDGSNF